ncbi:hypothetical protein ACFQ88_37305 [Paenibacillus sp. NPDC056579]|uniref:hypothetical protein n=1 Tax=Paenibacillus sp. NPDC056579 TaxID=3345871 RepID=UPI0036ACDCA8
MRRLPRRQGASKTAWRLVSERQPFREQVPASALTRITGRDTIEGIDCPSR